MKIETTPRDDHQMTVVAEFESGSLEKYKRQAARKISENSKIPGFRPGKAPYDIVRRLYGDEAIEKQAVELMVDDVYPEVVKESKVDPAGPGSLEKIISAEPPKFSFIIPMAPVVKLGDYRKLRKEYLPDPVTEDEVESFLKRLQTSFATAEPVERPIEKGDLVYLRLKGTLTKPAEGEDAEVIKEAPMQTIVGENTIQEDSWPYPGFSKELIGLSAKEEKTIKHKFKKDEGSEDLQGKEVALHVQIESVKALHLPELDNEFAQTAGNVESIDELKKSIRERLEAGKKEEYDRKYFDELVDELIGISTIQYPPQVLEDEMESVLHSLADDLAAQKLDFDTYLKLINKDRETFLNEQIKPAAAKRLERSLVLDQLSHEEKIALPKEDLENEFNKTLYDIQATTDMRQLRRKMSNERLANAIAMQAATRLMSKRTLERLKAIATGEEIKSEEKPADKPAKKKPKKADAEAESKVEANAPETEK